MSDTDLSSIINNYFSGNKLDKEKFRLYILDNFKAIRQKFLLETETPQFKVFLQKLNDHCVVNNFSDCQKAIQEIRTLDKTISDWITDLVDSPQRFEFTIMTKATELSSGDRDYDYYYALMIRHDQLLAALQIFRSSLVSVRSIVKFPDYADILKNPNFIYFSENSFQDKIYLMAQSIFENRKKLGKL